jgi:hypothetical protein
LWLIFLPTLFAILRDDEKMWRVFLPNLLCLMVLLVLFYWPGSLRVLCFSISISVGKTILVMTWALAWSQLLSVNRKPMGKFGLALLFLILSLYLSLGDAIWMDAIRSNAFFRHGLIIFLPILFQLFELGLAFILIMGLVVIPRMAKFFTKPRDLAGNRCD